MRAGGLDVQDRTGERKNGQRQDDELQKQQEILAQPLERTVHAQVVDRAPPEQRAGNYQFGTLALQEIQQHDPGQGQKPREGEQRGKAHLTSPPSRSAWSKKRSTGTSVAVVK